MNKHDDIDLFSDDVFENIRLPIINTRNPEKTSKMNEIENCFNGIMKLEKQCSLIAHKLKNEELQKHLDAHNEKVGKLAYHIDKIIYDLLELREQEIKDIEENLRLNKIYIPSFDKRVSKADQ